LFLSLILEVYFNGTFCRANNRNVTVDNGIAFLHGRAGMKNWSCRTREIVQAASAAAIRGRSSKLSAWLQLYAHRKENIYMFRTKRWEWEGAKWAARQRRGGAKAGNIAECPLAHLAASTGKRVTMAKKSSIERRAKIFPWDFSSAKSIFKTYCVRFNGNILLTVWEERWTLPYHWPLQIRENDESRRSWE